MKRQENVVYTYVPPKMYAFIVQIQAKHGLSIQEVMTAILRKGMNEFLGFSCTHNNIRPAKKTGKPYCFDCWTRMLELSPSVIDHKGKIKKPGQYSVIPSFLEDTETERNESHSTTSTGVRPGTMIEEQKNEHYII